MGLDVAYVDPGPIGYSPVIYMAELAARLMDGRLLRLPRHGASWSQKLSGVLPRRKGGDDCLLICPSPFDLGSFRMLPGWRKRYRHITAWVFDSFWPEAVPRWVKWAQPFDQLFVTEAEDLSTWRQQSSTPVEWLPWGADVLGMGSFATERSVDVFRIGRQPDAWQDDEVTAAACVERSLRFAGRPTGSEDAGENQRIVANALVKTKFSLSFSNAVSPSIQTHPHRQYITARWTDALACGVTVAGVAPKCVSVDKLFWPEALLELGTVELDSGLEILKQAVSRWTPALAELNHVRALERLDWRLRFETIAQCFGGQMSPVLTRELADLRARVAAWKLKVGDAAGAV